MTNSFVRRIVLACNIQTAFRLFTDDDFWRNSKLFGEIRWNGPLWAKGSVRMMEVRYPRPHWREQRVQNVEPEKSIAVLTHGLHYTTQTNLHFKATHSEETVVTWNVEIAGPSPDKAVDVEQLLELFYVAMTEVVQDSLAKIKKETGA